MRYLFSLSLIFCFLAQSSSSLATAADSSNSVLKQLKFRLKVGILYTPYDENLKAVRPNIIAPMFLGVKTNKTVGPSSPIFHGAAYMDFTFDIAKYGFNIHAELIAEHRSMSAGVTDTESMLVIPKYNFAFDSSFSIAGLKFGTGVSTGNFDYQRKFEGLNFFNIEYQGTVLYLNYDKYKLSYHKIGDLYYGGGLAIEDVDMLILSLDQIDLPANFKADFKAGLFYYTYSSVYNRGNDRKGITASAAVNNDDIKVYSEFSFSFSDYWRDPYSLYNIHKLDLQDKSAFLAGVNYKNSFGDLSFDLRAEYRWFGYYYNLNFSSRDAVYNPSPLTPHDPSQVYSLQRFERPFAQWAVFTEYQKKNVWGATCLLKAKYRLVDKIFAAIDLDFNYIRASNLEGFLYPFFQAGLMYEAVDGCDFSVMMTNRGMNFDHGYPTLHLYNTVIPQFSLHYKI